MRNENLKAIVAQIVVLLLSLFFLNFIFQGFFIENIPQKNWLYILHGKLLIWQKTCLIIILLVFLFSTNVLVKVAWDKNEHFIIRLILLLAIPLIYFSCSLIIQLLCGVPSIFYFKPSLIEFFAYLFSYGLVVVFITSVQYKYIVYPKESLILHLMKKIRAYLKDRKTE